MTNLEGRVIRRRARRWTRRPACATTCSSRRPRRAGSAPGGSAPTPRRSSTSCAGPARRHRRLRRDQLRADRREHGVFWPCPQADHPGTPRLFAERFATPDGRARFVRVEHVDAHEPPDAEYPYVLTTGRVLAQYQSGTQTRRTRSLQLIAPDAAGRAAPRPRPPARHRPGRRRRAATRRGRARGSTPTSPTRSGPTSSSRPSTGAAAPGPTPSPTRRWTPPAGCPPSRSAPVAVTRVGGPDERIPAPDPQPSRSRRRTAADPHHPAPRPGRGAPA